MHGELRVEPLGRDAGLFTAGLRLRPDDLDRWLTVGSASPLPGGDVVLRLLELCSRDDAAALRGAYLWVEERDARPLIENEWFVHQLVGLSARTSSGAQVGEVVDVESNPAHDVLVVGGSGGTQRFPMVAAFVERVDPAAGVIVIRPWDQEEGA